MDKRSMSRGEATAMNQEQDCLRLSAPPASTNSLIAAWCETPLRAGLLGLRVVSPHPQGLQGSHLNLSQTSAQATAP